MRISKIFSAVLVGLCVLMLAAPSLGAKGKFEYGVHYSGWSLNLIKGMIEGKLDSMGEQMKDDIVTDIQKDNPTLQESSYSQDVSFDSSGNNWGFEIRYYPGGYEGSFSIGLSVEKTSLKVGLDKADVSITLRDSVTSESGTAQAGGTGTFSYSPLSFHLHFRWDIKPSWTVHPFFTFGFGIAGVGSLKKATIAYSYNYTLNMPGEAPDTDSGGETKTLQQIDDENVADGEESMFESIPFFPFIQMTLGIKGRLGKNVYLLTEAGIFNGFLYRGGISFRF